MSGINKVILGNQTLIDLTGDTVTPYNLLRGYKAHTADGTPIEGLYDVTNDKLIKKVARHNGTYIASKENAVGYSRVTVNNQDTYATYIDGKIRRGESGLLQLQTVVVSGVTYLCLV